MPASEDWVNPATCNLEVEDVTLQLADGTRLHAWWCPVESTSNSHAPGALLYCHGNGECVGYLGPYLKELRDKHRATVFALILSSTASWRTVGSWSPGRKRLVAIAARNPRSSCA